MSNTIVESWDYKIHLYKTFHREKWKEIVSSIVQNTLLGLWPCILHFRSAMEEHLVIRWVFGSGKDMEKSAAAAAATTAATTSTTTTTTTTALLLLLLHYYHSYNCEDNCYHCCCHDCCCFLLLLLYLSYLCYHCLPGGTSQSWAGRARWHRRPGKTLLSLSAWRSLAPPRALLTTVTKITAVSRTLLSV